MPKVNLPELQALAEYLTNKVPRMGMFSTLKGVIENSPQERMTAQQWQQYLNPGNTSAVREGVVFPLKQEEVDYSGIPSFLGGFKPTEKLTRDQLMEQYLKGAPNFNTILGSPEASVGQAPEQKVLKNLGVPQASTRMSGREGQHSTYSHAERGASPDQAASPWGSKQYQVDVTTSPNIPPMEGTHFSPQDISWNRTNRLPLAGETWELNEAGKPVGRTGRLIEEIQSDRHQKAVDAGQFRPSPEQTQQITDLANNLVTKGYDKDTVISAWGDPLRFANSEIAKEPEWQQMAKIRQQATPRLGYRTPEGQARLKELESMPEIQDPWQAQRDTSRLGFDPTGEDQDLRNIPDPALAKRIADLQREHGRLMSQVPDAPFKKMQGYAGFEMRKALNDAIRSGDQALGLVTGEDQNAFYGRRFNNDQTSGQNYAYNVGYPPILEKLGRQYGFPSKPMDVSLKARPADPSAYWPLRRMKTMDTDLGNSIDPANHTAENYFNWAATKGPIDEPTHLSRLFGEIEEKLDSDAVHQLRMNHTDPDTGELVPDTTYNKFHDALQEMRSHGEGMNDITWRAYENAPVEEEDAAKAAATQTPEYLAHQSQYDAAKAQVHSLMKPVFDFYKDKYGKTVGNDLTRTKRFENAIDLSDPDLLERARKAGVPVWALAGATVGGGAMLGAPEDSQASEGQAQGGPIDYVAQARTHLGGGGEVKTAMGIGDLIEQFLNHYHDFMRGSIESLTPEMAQKTSSMAEQLRAHGVEPNDVIQDAMAQKPIGATEHAEGGRINMMTMAPEDDAPSSLATITNWVRDHYPTHPLLRPDVTTTDNQDMARITKSLLQPFYGQDVAGHVRFLGGGPQFDVKTGDLTMGRPAAIDEATSMIHGAKHGLDWLSQKLSGQSSKTPSTLITGEQVDPVEERLSKLKAAVSKETGIGAPHTFVEHMEDAIPGAVIPIPGLQEEEGALAVGRAGKALKELNPVGHLLANFGASPADPLKYAEMSGLWGGQSGALNYALDPHKGEPPPSSNTADIDKPFQDYLMEHATRSGPMEPEDFVTQAGSHSSPGMAEGGQPSPDATQPSPTEDDLLTQMLQMRAMTQRLPTYEVPQQYGGGGEVGIAEKLAQLFAKLTQKAEPAMASAAPAARVPLTSKDLDIPPPNIAANIAAISPEMKAHVDDILSRKWTADLPGKLYQGIGMTPGADESALTDAAMSNANKATGGTIHPKIQAMLSLLKAGLKPVAPSFKYQAQLRPQEEFQGAEQSMPMMGGSGMDSTAVAALLARLSAAHPVAPAAPAAPAEEPAAARGGRFKRMYGSPALYTTVPGTSGVGDDGSGSGSGGGGGMADGGDVDWDEIRRRLHVLQHPMIEGTPSKVPPPPAVTNNGPPPVSFHLDPDIIQKLMAMDAMGKQTMSKGYEMNKSALDKLVADSKAEGTYDEHADNGMFDKDLRRGGRAKHKRKAVKVHGGMRARG